MALVVLRHGERTDYVEPSWVSSAQRPWDPPLTDTGREQAWLAGAAIRTHLLKLGLPPVTRGFTSPLIRCAETATIAVGALGSSFLCGVEPSLSEITDRSWYHSWGVPGANSVWGGPAHCRVGTEVPRDKLHPAVFQPAGKLFLRRHEFPENISGKLSREYSPYLPASDFNACWDSPETETEVFSRVSRFAESCISNFSRETTLLCTHGGPATFLYEGLCDPLDQIECGYTAIFVLVKYWPNWKALVKGNVDHLPAEDSLATAALPP